MTEINEQEKKQKEIVRVQLMTIGGLIQRGQDLMLSKFGAKFGSTILDNLPPRVQTFSLSNEYPFVAATRDDNTGTEYWSGKQASEWATEDFSPELSESVKSEIGVIK